MSKSLVKQRKRIFPHKMTSVVSFSSLISEIKTSSQVLEEKESPSKEAYFDKIKNILLKTQRSPNELIILQQYLSTLPSLMSILSESAGNIDNLIATIALHLKYERIPPNTIICRLGEKGNKFYIILNGTVSILIPKEIKISMTLFQYVQHLLLLIIIEEVELLTMTIKQNKQIHPIDINYLTQFIENHAKINVDLMSFDGVEVMQLKSFVAGTRAAYGHRTKFSYTTNEYIKISQPQLKNMNSNYNNDLLKSNLSNSVSLFTYFEVTKLTKGSTFGERALITTVKKRTGTILSEPGVILGTLTRKAFDLCIKDIHKKILHGNIHFLQSFKIFSTLSWYLLSSKFLNFFKLKFLKQNEMLINENNAANEIYFVREGEFEVTANMSSDDIEYYINLFQNKRKHLKRRINLEGKKKQMRIALVKEPDIIGLDDMTHDGKYIFGARCISIKAIVFGIEMKAFETIVLKIKDVLDNCKDFVAVRKSMFVSRLESYQYIQSNQIKDIGSNRKTPLDRVRACFSAKPRLKSREKVNKRTHMTPLKNKQLFLASIAKCESKTPIHYKPYITSNTNDHNHNHCDDREEKQVISSSHREILQNKSRNARPLSPNDTYTLTTTNLITNTHNNMNEVCLGVRDNRRTSLSMKFSQSNKKKKTHRETKPFSERFLKKIVGTSYKEKDHHLLLSEIIRQNHAKSISKDKETIISIIDFDRYDTQMTYGNLKEFEFIDQPCPIYHKALSPKTLPLNYMDKSKPLRLSIKKQRHETYSNEQM